MTSWVLFSTPTMSHYIDGAGRLDATIVLYHSKVVILTDIIDMFSNNTSEWTSEMTNYL